MRPPARPPSLWTVPSSGRTGTSPRSCNTCNWRPYGWRTLGGSGSASRRSLRSSACEAPTAEPHGGRWGPRGTKKMMSHLEQAYEYDIRIRLYDDRAAPDRIVLLAEDISEGVVYDKGGVKITAFEVDHTPVKP